MARTPDIAVRIRSEGIAAARASFKALQASATRSFNFVEKGASQARASLSAISKPVMVTIGGMAKVAQMTAAVGVLAAALAGLEIGKDLDAGNAVNSYKAGIEVAIDKTSELKQQLQDARTEFDRTPISQAGPILAQIRSLEAQVAATRDVGKAVDTQWRRIIGTANELGAEVEKVAPGFVQLANATKGTASAGKTTDDTFRGMLQVSRALGLSADKTASALTAVAQVSAKGKYSAEEGQQLAEAGIPAAKILQRAMKVNDQQFAQMQQQGISAETFLKAFSAELTKEFGPKAAELAKGPAASFARLKNSIFLARAEVSNGGMAKGLAVIADSATRLVDRLAATGKLAQFGATIGRGLEGIPGLLQRVAIQYGILSVYAGRWRDQMRVALGIDTAGWADKTAASFAWVRQALLQLAFDIPGVIYALRQAFAGNDGNVTERYAWVLPLRDFIQNQLIPLLAKVPGMVEKWAPIFLSVIGSMLTVMQTVRSVMTSVFGEEMANKITAFLIIGRVTGMLSGLAGAFSFVATAIRGVVAVFNIMRAAALILFTPPAGLIIAAIAAVAALAYVIYQNWDSIKAFLTGIWDGIKAAATGFIDGLKAVWNGLTDMLTKPFELAKRAISAILDGLSKAVEYSPVGLIFKGGKFLIEQGAKAAGYATGGMIRGPGTGTSDSIPIWASHGEGMVNAAATRAYGGERFIDSLNDQTFSGFGAPADVIEVQSGSSGRPMSIVMPGVGTASGAASNDLADGMQRLFDKAQAGRGRQKKGRGYR